MSRTPCDTPSVAIAHSGASDLQPAAELPVAAWRSVTPWIAGTQHVRISRDGGRTYPARHVRLLPAEPPDQPCTVPVYEPGTATGRMLALDLDRGRGDVDHQAAELGQLLERFGALSRSPVTRWPGFCVPARAGAPLGVNGQSRQQCWALSASRKSELYSPRNAEGPR